MSGRRDATSLTEALATPGAKQRYVRRLFATIADRYDVVTRLLSFGQDQRWKRRLISLAGVAGGARTLDLACGTGDLAILAAREGGRVIALDVTHRMLVLARTRPGAAHIGWMTGDMGALPIADASFDVVTTGYGLRNVPVLDRAIAEIHRVLRPGGVFASLDFTRPESPFVRAVFLGYLTVVGGALGMLMHGDPDTYRYIPASIRTYPGALGLSGLLRAAGFREVRHHRVFGGLMAIHVARK